VYAFWSGINSHQGTWHPILRNPPPFGTSSSFYGCPWKIFPQFCWCNRSYLRLWEAYMRRALYSQSHWRISLLINECHEDNSTHSKLVICKWCKLFDGSGSVLAHHASEEKSANFNLVESLPCAYRCCISGGNCLSDHSFDIALYIWHSLSVRFCSTWLWALL